VLTGIASNAPAIDRAVQLARTYAGEKVVNMVSVGASQQVMLEVRFSEVRRDTAKRIGIGAFLNSASGRFDGVFGNGAQLVPDADTGVGVMRRSAVTDTFGIFRQLFTVGGVSIEGTLDALENKGLVKTLARPTLIALSGETASFLAGGEFPIPVVQSSGGTGTGNGGNQGITIEFKPFGVSLAFTPTVLADGIISLAVEPEVSSLDSSASVQINGLSIPGLRTRRASTVLELRDGEAFAIAGLLQQDYGTTVRQLPILGSLPIIGTLFRSSGFQKGETELVIVVIPRLVQPTRPENVSLPTDRVKNASEGDLFLMASIRSTPRRRPWARLRLKRLPLAGAARHLQIRQRERAAMNIDRLCIALMLAPLGLAACTPVDTGFGDSVKSNAAAQVIDPDVRYDAPLAVASGARMAPAVERYRTDKVKVPKGIRTTNAGTTGSGSGGLGR
jgi:pilus assembly protein CpaC